MDEAEMKIGLLMEAAQAHQMLAEKALLRLKDAVDGLDAVIGEEVRRAFTEELRELCVEVKRTEQTLRTAARAAQVRRAGWGAAIATLCTLMAMGIVLAGGWLLLPSRSQVAALREEHERLSVGVDRLSRRGGRADLRRCGEDRRVCVRVDTRAPAFGEQKDYFVIKGY